MSEKLISCRVCGQPISSKAKVCPHCGAKKKVPVYKKVWFWFLVIILSMTFRMMFSSGRESLSNTAGSSASAAVQQSMVESNASVNSSKTVIADSAAESDAGSNATAAQAVQAEATAPQEDAGSTKAQNYSSESFRAFCDDYEAFIDEYVEFMQNYSKNASDLSYAAKLLTMEQDLLKWEADMEKYEDYNLTDADALYFAEVELRCSQKLLEAAN